MLCERKAVRWPGWAVRHFFLKVPAGAGPLGIGAVVFGLALAFGGGYELAMRVAQIRHLRRGSRQTVS